MKTFSIALALTCVITISVSAQTKDSGQRFDTPPPKAARDLVKRGVELAGQDRVDEAIAAVKKAIAISPNYLEAHQEYLRLKTDFQGKVPLLSRTYAKYKDRGFEIMAVSGDDPTERDKVLQFARTHGLTFPVLYDDGVAKLYDVAGYPANAFIDRQGNIRYSQAGAFDEGDRRLEIIISELMK